MIIWLASYPKSGNTWVRAFISSVIYSQKGVNDFSNLEKIPQFPRRDQFSNLVNNLQDPREISQNWKSSQDFINLDSKVKFLKTHHALCKIKNYDFTDNSNSLGVIYIVRDPRTVLLSLKHHFGMKDFTEAKNFIFNEHVWLGINKSENYKNNSNKVPTLISSWKVNYLSWKDKIQNYLLIRYEDLLKNPHEEFFRITDYLENLINFKIDKDKINNAIKSTSFETMQKLEKDGYFKEQGKGAKFFNSGPNADWRSQLDNKIIDEINLKFKNEMIELGYL